MFSHEQRMHLKIILPDLTSIILKTKKKRTSARPVRIFLRII